MKEILNIVLLYFHLFPVSYYWEGTGAVSKRWEDLKKPCFGIFTRPLEVNMRIVMEPLKGL